MTKDEIRRWLTAFVADSKRGISVYEWSRYFALYPSQIKSAIEGGVITPAMQARLERAIAEWTTGRVIPKFVLLPGKKRGVIAVQALDIAPKIEPAGRIVFGAGGVRLQVGPRNVRDY